MNDSSDIRHHGCYNYTIDIKIYFKKRLKK